MASSLKNLSQHTTISSTILPHRTIAILVSEYHTEITESLFQGAYDTLIGQGASPARVLRYTAPGTFELPLSAQRLVQQSDIDAVICIGCVIQGETRHFDFICQTVAQGIMDVQLRYNKPVIFGVLTPNTLQQAQDRAGGKYGNKGVEAAMAAINMLIWSSSYEKFNT